jgi:hypothetical protein
MRASVWGCYIEDYGVLSNSRHAGILAGYREPQTKADLADEFAKIEKGT